MTRLRHLAAVGAAAMLAGCGSSDDERGPGIPSELVQQITRQLDLVQDRIDVTRETDKVGSCNDVELRSIPDIEGLAAQVPKDTDPEIVDALEQGIVRLRELASQECSDLENRVDQNTETTPPETIPQETVTETAPQETTPQETETQPQEQTPGNGKEKKDKGNDGDATPPGQGGGGAPAPLPGEGN